MTAGFWEALEQAAVAPAARSAVPRRDAKALADACAFHEDMRLDQERLSRLGVEVTRLDTTVSFRRNGYGLVSVHFGAGEAGANRVISAVAVHLGREPAFEDVPDGQGVAAAAGRWLGLSIDLIVKNPEAFQRFGFA